MEILLSDQLVRYIGHSLEQQPLQLFGLLLFLVPLDLLPVRISPAT